MGKLFMLVVILTSSSSVQELLHSVLTKAIEAIFEWSGSYGIVSARSICMHVLQLLAMCHRIHT